MRVPFNNLGMQWNEIKNNVLPKLENIMNNSSYILGKDVLEFESDFAKYVNSEYAIGCASGLDALKLALLVLGISDGDEVILPANTFIATALSVTSVGAIPILVDCDEVSFCINPKKIEEKISNKTKVIIPVHLYGRPADMDPILELAAKYSLSIIEDASQAHGAIYKGRKVGSIGDLGAFSLYPGKNLGACGDAGVITTNKVEFKDKLISLRNYGSTKRYVHETLGENSRLDTIQAAILGEKLKRLDEWNKVRRATAKRYLSELAGVGDLVLPEENSLFENVYHLFVIRTKYREALIEFLNRKNVDNLIHYPTPVHLQKAYEDAFQGQSYPVSEKVAAEILSIPIFAHITDEEVTYVIQAIKDFYKNAIYKE
jgi:dTDP-4-amino-4,6-dideoxygalactose transaminase